MSSSTVRLHEFSLFPKLSLEVRLQIWRASHPEPRVVRVDYNEALGKCTSSTPVPIALQINQESRNETLQYYILSFGPLAAEHENTDTATTIPTPGGRIYFNFEVDTFYMLPGVRLEKPLRGNDEQDIASGASEELEEQSWALMGALKAISMLVKITHGTAQLNQVRLLGVSIELMVAVTLVERHFVPAGETGRWFKHFNKDCLGFFLLEDKRENTSLRDRHVILAIKHGKTAAMRDDDGGSTSGRLMSAGETDAGNNIASTMGKLIDFDSDDESDGEQSSQTVENWKEFRKTLELTSESSGFTWNIAYVTAQHSFFEQKYAEELLKCNQL